MKPLKLGPTALAWYHERNRAGIPVDWLIGEAGRARDGTLVRFGLQRVGEQIVDARYEVFGCPAAIAAAAWVADHVAEAALTVAASLYGRSIAAALELPAEKMGVVLVVEDALRSALAATGASNGNSV